MKGLGEMRGFIADKHDTSGMTGRLYDLGILPPQPAPIIKDTLVLLKGGSRGRSTVFGDADRVSLVKKYGKYTLSSSLSYNRLDSKSKF